MLQTSNSPEATGLRASLADAGTGECTSFFEDVSNQDPLHSIEHFCRSNQSYQRLAYAQGIAAAAAAPTADYGDCVEVLLPVIQQLAKDHEAEIRSTAVKQMPGLGTALYSKDAERSMRDVEATLLVCAQQCAIDDDDEVSHAAIITFQQLVQLLPPARATAASKRAVDRLESNGSEDGTLAAVRLLAHTVGHWTPEALRRHVPRYISRWASHREFSVREAVATCMSLIVPPMPLRLCHQVLLPAFYQLSRDQNWRVRRACSLDLPRLAEGLHKQAAQASIGSGDADSNHQPPADDAEQPLGCCSSKASSCLRSMQRFGTDVGSASSTMLAAGLAAAGPQRNKSYPSLNVHRAPATSAQIMTKHPMHSSLITDGLLSGSSSCNSLPGSPSGSSDGPSLAQEGVEDDAHQQQQQEQHHQQEQQQPPQQQQQHHHHQQQHCHHHHHGSLSDSDQVPEQQQGAPCSLQQEADLLHDCWCALRQCMELLSADSSHWVKVAALSGLGPFLLQLPPCQLGQLLLCRFTSMAGSTVVIYEVSVALSCAQAFGQLAVLLGPERWHDMRDAWHALQASRDPQVLCELVSCLPQLMAALGPVLAHREMVPALAGLLQSHLSWVAGQLVQVMASMLEHLPPSGHELLLKTLPQLTANSGDRSRSWRVRRDLALQLGRLAAVAGPEAIQNCLWPTAMSLCCDPVAAVRTAAAAQVGPIMAALPAHVLQAHNGDAAADNCAACRSSSSSQMCSSSFTVPRHKRCSSADMQHDAAEPSAGPPATSQGELPVVCSSGNDVDGDSSQHERQASNSAAAATPTMPVKSKGGLSKTSSSSSSKSRGFGVRFAVDRHMSSSAPHNVGRSGLLSELVADTRHGVGAGSGMDFDELELPSALAPAPAGCFSQHAAAGSSGDDSDDAADDGGAGSASSGLSSSSSHSSDGGAHESGSSSSDESGNDSSDGSDSDSEEDLSSSSSSSRWRGVVPTSNEDHNTDADAAAAASGHDAASAAAPPNVNGDAAATDGSRLDSPTPATTTPPRSLYAMHPAMMPVGALSAAAAAAQSSAPRAVPAAKHRQMPSRARSAGDLLHLQPSSADSSSADEAPGHLRQHTTPSRFKPQQQQQQGSTRHLPDSLPAGLLGAGGSSDDEVSQRSSGSWPGGLPAPAHAAPHQYLPCLVEYFGCSSSHQQRQLFVPLVMGLLAACHEDLSCAQQALLLDRLEALAHDNVPGVRYAVAVALAGVKLQAAALTGQQQQQDGQQLQQQQAGASSDAAVADGNGQEAVQQQQQVELVQPHSNGVQVAELQAGKDDAESAAVQSQQHVQEEGVHLKQDAACEQQQRQAELEQQQQCSTPEPTVCHVPKGAHPLLGYQAYVQQLARQSSVPPPSPSSTVNACSSSSSSASGQSSPALSKSAASAPGRASPALPPRSSASPAASNRQPNSRQRSAATKQQHAPAGTVAAPATPSKDKAAAVAVGSAGAAAASAADGDDAKTAEWIRKLSNCQQLERLMHVVALTTGPL